MKVRSPRTRRALPVAAFRRRRNDKTFTGACDTKGLSAGQQGPEGGGKCSHG
jgi:hypothetical protein